MCKQIDTSFNGGTNLLNISFVFLKTKQDPADVASPHVHHGEDLGSGEAAFVSEG